MSVYTELLIDDYTVLLSKNIVDSEVMFMFSDNDKKNYERDLASQNNIICGILENNSSDTIVEYKTSVQSAIDRLEEQGITLEKVKSDFKNSNTELVDFTFDDFLEAFRELRKKNIPYYKCEVQYEITDLARHLTSDGLFLNYPHSQVVFYLRAYLESCVNEAFVILDITELMNLAQEKPINK